MALDFPFAPSSIASNGANRVTGPKRSGSPKPAIVSHHWKGNPMVNRLVWLHGELGSCMDILVLDEDDELDDEDWNDKDNWGDDEEDDELDDEDWDGRDEDDD